MKDLVRIEDYLKWLKSMIDLHKTKDIELQDRYAKAKEVYENKRIPKFFGWKYEKSSQGCSDPFFGPWNLDRHKNWIESFEEEVERCIYQQKIKNVMITLPEGWYDSFYNWCKKNDIPY